MKKYYAIINEEGRFLKFRTGSNGINHAWVNELMGASIGTENQMCNAIEQLKNSPFYASLKLYYIGEAESGWMAKIKVLKTKM